MPKDSRRWEQAYRSYGRYAPNSKYNNIEVPIKKKVFVRKEIMVLQEEYNQIILQLKELNSRRRKIKKEMQKTGHTPIKRPEYFERPILLYALKLEGECWYVGMSRNVDRRFKAHKKGGTIWTSLHKPIEVYEVRETGSNSDSEVGGLENEMTFEYARMYGPDKVRGGGYCQSKPKWPSHIFEPELYNL